MMAGLSVRSFVVQTNCTNVPRKVSRATSTTKAPQHPNYRNSAKKVALQAGRQVYRTEQTLTSFPEFCWRAGWMAGQGDCSRIVVVVISEGSRFGGAA